MRTNVYIDGFNLYFGAVKSTPYKWLDLNKFCKLLLPQNEIYQIKYFTALVRPRPQDPLQPLRQQIYLRALKTIPNLSIILGHFLTHEVMMPLAETVDGKTKYVKVIKTEEKGSDVNLAAHLLNDAYKNDFEIAAIVSNDSDLLEPIRIVRSQLNKGVGIINPHAKPSRELLKNALFYKKVRRGLLAASQFPPIMSDANGSFHKPETW